MVPCDCWPLLPGLREDDRGGGSGGDGMAEDGGVIFEDPRLTAIIAPLSDFVETLV